MHYIDLLNYLIDVQKIEKDDLCELLAIPKKKLDSVLSGITPLKKKCLKNLSLYTNIPLDAIRSGNFVLNIPQAEVVEGEEAPKIIKDAYVPEYIREANTKRLKAYCKKRYRSENQDVTLLNVFQTISTVVCIISLVVMMLGFSIVNMFDCAKVFVTGILPVLLSIIIKKATYKLAKNGTPPENKLFKLHTILLTIQLLIYAGSIIAFGWASPVLIIFAILYILPIIHIVFTDNKPIFSKIKTTLYVLFSILSLVLFHVFTLYGEKFTSLENSEIVILIIFIGFLGVATAMGTLIANYIYFTKRNYIAKHFGHVSRKRALKENHIFKSVFAIILAVVIIVCTTLYLPVLAFNSVKNVFNSTIGVNTDEPRYFSYDKTECTFNENDKCQLIEYDNYFFTVPESLVKSTESEAYKDEAMPMVVLASEQRILFDEDFDDILESTEIPFDVKQTIKDEYGFFPKTEYEYFKLLKIIDENNVNIFNRELLFSTFIMSYAELLASDSDVYLYDNSNMECVIKIVTHERSDGITVFTYLVSGNKKGNYDKFIELRITTTEEIKDADLPYKIINSIKMK